MHTRRTCSHAHLRKHATATWRCCLWARGRVFLSGRRVPGHSGSGGLPAAQQVELLLLPGWGGRSSEGWLLFLHACPSTMRPSTGERLCSRPTRTLTELSPCFCLLPPPEGDASDRSRLPVVSVTAAEPKAALSVQCHCSCGLQQGIRAKTNGCTRL